jgi:hypothetical protein
VLIEIRPAAGVARRDPAECVLAGFPGHSERDRRHARGSVSS